MMEWPQSLPLCILFSVLAGLCLVLSTTCLAYVSHKDKEQKKKEDDEEKCSKNNEEDNDTNNHEDKSPPSSSSAVPSRTAWALAYFGNITFQVLSFGFQTLSTFVGPVSVASPLSTSAQLLSNVIIFGVLLKYEELQKDTLVGTLVAVVGINLLVIVGPRFEDMDTKPDILDMLQETKAIAWVVVMAGTSALAFPYHFVLGCSSINSKLRLVTESRSFVFLMASEVSNSVLAASSLKMLSLVDGIALVTVIFVALYANGTLLYASMLRAVAIKHQSIYLPIGIALFLACNAITGALVWQDDILSRAGYTWVFVLFALGSFLLSDFDPFDSANAQFKYGSACEKWFCMAHNSGNSRSSLIHTKAAARRGISIRDMPKVYDRLSQQQEQPNSSHQSKKKLTDTFAVDNKGVAEAASVGGDDVENQQSNNRSLVTNTTTFAGSPDVVSKKKSVCIMQQRDDDENALLQDDDKHG